MTHSSPSNIARQCGEGAKNSVQISLWSYLKVKLDRAAILLSLALIVLAALKFFGSPFFVPWWVGLGGALVIILVLVFRRSD